jgi:hypothetical protein
MRAVIAHGRTQQQAIEAVDRFSNNLFDFGSASVELADQTKNWTGPVMAFSFVAKYGFISLPLNGTVTVDDTNVTIDCELPALVKNFVGEDKLRDGIEKHVTRLLAN